MRTKEKVPVIYFVLPGAVDTLLGRAKERMVSRDPFASKLLAEDFQLRAAGAASGTGPLELLDSMYKVERKWAWCSCSCCPRL